MQTADSPGDACDLASVSAPNQHPAAGLHVCSVRDTVVASTCRRPTHLGLKYYRIGVSHRCDQHSAMFKCPHRRPMSLRGPKLKTSKVASPARSVWLEPCRVAHMQFEKSGRRQCYPALGIAQVQWSLLHEAISHTPKTHAETQRAAQIHRRTSRLATAPSCVPTSLCTEHAARCYCCFSRIQQAGTRHGRPKTQRSRPTLIHATTSLSPATPTTAPRSTARPPSTRATVLRQAARGAV